MVPNGAYLWDADKICVTNNILLILLDKIIRNNYN